MSNGPSFFSPRDGRYLLARYSWARRRSGEAVGRIPESEFVRETGRDSISLRSVVRAIEVSLLWRVPGQISLADMASRSGRARRAARYCCWVPPSCVQGVSTVRCPGGLPWRAGRRSEEGRAAHAWVEWTLDRRGKIMDSALTQVARCVHPQANVPPSRLSRRPSSQRTGWWHLPRGRSMT